MNLFTPRVRNALQSREQSAGRKRKGGWITMLSYWILERARQTVIGSVDDEHRIRRIALNAFGALTMLAVALAVF